LRGCFPLPRGHVRGERRAFLAHRLWIGDFFLGQVRGPFNKGRIGFIAGGAVFSNGRTEFLLEYPIGAPQSLHSNGRFPGIGLRGGPLNSVSDRHLLGIGYPFPARFGLNLRVCGEAGDFLFPGRRNRLTEPGGKIAGTISSPRRAPLRPRAPVRAGAHFPARRRR